MIHSCNPLLRAPAAPTLETQLHRAFIVPPLPSNRRPASGHDTIPFIPDFFELLNGAGPAGAGSRHGGDKPAARLSQEYDHLPPTTGTALLPSCLSVSVCTAPRPGRPSPAPDPLPEVLHHHRRSHGKTSGGHHSADGKIARLMGEGYSFEDVKRALMIAQNKVDVARHILREFALVAPRLNLQP
ncbi:hypothetical protein AAFF_G00237710 [Aldrovandia affinis]|uniref:Uncharacterized protein n=1 Tax=Aldrovandia affinis TaxID=143900 RepID=A0AAD7REC5_9TELE|nr:hypothetical protein AAFF_G00237710 [Aldrovandia affinis]